MNGWARNANFLIRMALVAPLALAAWSFLPTYWANTQLEQYMEKVALTATVHGNTASQIIGVVLRKSRELELPIRERQIAVEVEEDQVTIEAKYQAPLDLVLTRLNLDFHPRARGRKPKLTQGEFNEMKELVR